MAAAGLMRVLVDVIYTSGIEARTAADNAVDGITFEQEEFAEVGTVLAGDTCDEGGFSHGSGILATRWLGCGESTCSTGAPALAYSTMRARATDSGWMKLLSACSRSALSDEKSRQEEQSCGTECGRLGDASESSHKTAAIVREATGAIADLERKYSTRW